MKTMTMQDPCTCGSGRSVENCCFKKVNTRPPLPKTGYSHPKCYARAMGDCCRKITGEHFASKGVLALFGDSARVSTPFLKEGGKILNPTSMKSNVLCKRHNEALSPLDALAKKFFEFALGRTEHDALIISGADLELWMLKLMCGLIATGHGYFSNGKQITNIEPPHAALATLFGSLKIPDKWGLVIPKKPNVVLQDHMSFNIMSDGHQAKGCSVQFAYVRLLFLLHPAQEVQKSLKAGTRIYHRPSSIGLTVDEVYRKIHLGWPEGEHVDISFKTERKRCD